MWLSATACTDTDADPIGSKGNGEPCNQISNCAAGLDCVDGVCAPLPSLGDGPRRGDPCDNHDDCGEELYCGRQGVCTLSPGLTADQPCGLTVECEDPLVCNGATGVCAVDDGGPGSLELGETCEQLNDCQRPLVCNLQGVCGPLPFYAGPNCSRSDTDGGAFRVYFEVPGLPASDDHEFYRLPFPNDIRAPGGEVTLDGHASPNEVLGLGVPETYMAAIEEDADGFAVNQPVFFRFSGAVDPGSICLDVGSVYPESVGPDAPTFCDEGGNATVYMVRVSDGQRVPVQLAMGSEAGQYICQNWLGISPKDGEPLAHSTTYAAVITTGVVSAAGVPALPDTDFLGFMNGTTAIPAMTPLKEWATAESVALDSIAGATVFTTGNPDALGTNLRTAVRAQPTPAFDNNEAACDGSGSETVPAACAPSAADRGCLRGYTDFAVVQGTYDAPVFQAGDRPYAQEGGAMVLDDETDLPTAQGTETMCYAMAFPTTPPTQTAPAYPVIIYAHGTGGNYRSFLDQTLADGTPIAKALTDLGFAVISFDNVMHGPRQQNPGTPLTPELWQDPGRLFFNLANPRAARDNILQGAADLFHLTWLLTQPGAGPGGIQFDADNIYFVGHSQGTVIAPAFLAAETDVQAAVLSGAGAELALSILNKKEPMDVSMAAAAFFSDQALSRIHPMMGLLAMLFAPSDAVSYAPTWVTDPLFSPLPLLQFTGVGDSYTPDVTQHSLIRAAGLPLVGTVAVPIDGVLELASPQTNNLNGVSAGAIQFDPGDSYDGHFVMFKEPAAQNALLQFLNQALLVGNPVVQR